MSSFDRETIGKSIGSQIKGDDTEYASPVFDLLPRPLRQTCYKVASQIKVGKESVRDIYFEHEHMANWERNYFRAKLTRGTPFKDWVRYSSAFLTESIRIAKLKGGSKASNFFRSNPHLSVVLGNWILNNHLMYYGFRTDIVNFPLLLYGIDPNIRGAVIKTIYTILRDSGCAIHTYPDGLPYLDYPYVDLDNRSKSIQTASDLLARWERKFDVVGLDKVPDDELLPLVRYISRQRGEFFLTRFPIILSFNDAKRGVNPGVREYVMEFEIDA